MKTYLETKDYFYSQENFKLLYNADMEMLQTSPLPSNPENYYQSESYISHSDQTSSLFDIAYGLVKRFTLQRKVALLNRLLPNHGTLLDIGAGTGDFLITAKLHEWQVTGVEPNPLARKNALNKGIILNETLQQLPKNKYDIITLWHVLEHLPNLNKQITDITKLLKNNGFLIVAVPNYKSYDAHYYKEHWAAYDVPRHLWHFSKTSILKLFHPFGLELFKTKPMWFDSFYVSLLSEKYKTGKIRYITALLRGFMSNFKGLSSKEYSSHIYILKKG